MDLDQKMKAQKAEHIIHQVAVALDASLQSSQALQIAAELAATLQVRLEGIFVEDINLIRIAELPFTREIRAASLTREAVELQRMEQELKSLANQERQRLEKIAQEKGISCSFRIRRGHIKSELMQYVSEVDVLTISMSGQQMPEKFWQRRTARRVNEAAGRFQTKAPVTV